MPDKESKLRHPKWRNLPGRQVREYEVKGRVVCPTCDGKGCDSMCNRRGWMIDESAIQEEWDG